MQIPKLSSQQLGSGALVSPGPCPEDGLTSARRQGVSPTSRILGGGPLVLSKDRGLGVLHAGCAVCSWSGQARELGQKPLTLWPGLGGDCCPPPAGMGRGDWGDAAKGW